MAALTWRRASIKPGHVFPRHAHMEWSLSVVFAGAGFLRAADVVHEAPPGSITVLHPGEPHVSWVHRRFGLEYLLVTFDDRLVSRWGSPGGARRFTDRVIHDPSCAAALETACGQASKTAVEAALAALYQRHAVPGPPPSSESAIVRSVRQHIDAHYGTALSLDDMAALANVSTATLVRRFQIDVGMPPYQYLLSRRIDAARALLGSGRSLPDIAQRAGFFDQSHFHRHFMRTIGMSPGYFRDRQAFPLDRPWASTSRSR